MADDLYVLNEGENIPTDFTATPSAGTFNIKTSVNPRAVSINASSSTTLGINCYEIHSDDESTMGSGTVASSKLNRLFPVSTTIADYADNIIENAGFRVTIDTGNASGLTLDTTRDYFVVVYADNVKKHHVAKITEQTQYDGNSYHFEFSPRLKENITVGTKVTIYQGPLKTDNVVAVGYGLLNDVDTSEERHDKYVDISRPTFYFYEGDKLDHDRKYTLLKVSTNFTGEKKSVFKTAPLSSDMIIDKSFFTHHGDLTDNNRANDNLSTPREINAYNSQGSTYTFDRTTWAGSSKNIYDSDGGLSTYITFIDSPVKNQIHSSPYYVNVNKTVTNKGNMATVKFFDVEKILDKKINTYERFKVKQFITEKKLDRIASSALPGNCTNTTSNTFTVSGLVAGEDWRKVLYDGSSVYEPVFIENYYYVISNITAPANGEQVITVTHKRLLTANAFSSVGTLETFSAKKGYRKTWSPVSQTFLADHQIDTQIDFSNAITRNGITVTASDSDVNGIEYILEDSKDSVILEVDKGDKDTGYTKITSRPASNFFSSKYLTDSITGKLIVNNPIFDGFVETKKADVKQGFKYEIVGRDSISKLLNTSLNKNYVHSEEMVYTTFNPIVGDVDNTNEFAYVTLIISSINGKELTTSQDPTGRLTTGDVIGLDLNDDRYVILGVVDSVSSSPNKVTLMKDSYITDLTNIGTSTLNGNRIYKIRKTIIPHKNLETTPRINNRATSIAGTLDKGIVFGSGKTFSGFPLTFGEPKAFAFSGTVSSSNIVLDNLHEAQRLNVGDFIISSIYPLGTKISTISYDTIVPSNSPTTTGSTTIVFSTSIKNGFDIDDFITPITNSDGEYLDFPLGFKTGLNIPASTPDMEIISSEQTGEGSVLYELGYVSPIVLGMVAKNNNDKFISGSNEDKTHAIRLINGQGLPDGGFLHLLSSYTNSDYSPKTFNNIFSDDPAFVSTVKSQYALRYTQPIFRYSSKNKINAPLLQPYTNKYVKVNENRGGTGPSILYDRNDYYEKSNNFNFYLSSYKINRKEIDYDKDNSDFWLKGYPKEQTGIYPTLGSRFFDINRVPTWYYNSVDFLGNRFTTDNVYEALRFYVGQMELHDPSALSMHLFSLGDVYPESKLSANNIFKTDRDVNDYSIMFKKRKSVNSETSSTGYTNFNDLHMPTNIQVSSRLDDEYHTEPISSSDGEQVRFNLMRLTDVTFDMLFNEVDYENYEVNDMGTEISKGFTSTSSAGVRPQMLLKSFPQAGLHNVDVKVTSAHSDSDKLNVTTTHWYNSDYEYYIYAYINSLSYPTFVGRVNTATSNILTFHSGIPTSANVTDVVLYVRSIGLESGTSEYFENNKMLLTKEGTLPYLPETSNVNPHNYNKTAFFTNTDDFKDASTNVFNSAISVTNKSAIIRTPIFVNSRAGFTNGVISTTENSDLAAVTIAPNFHLSVSVTTSGDTITLQDSDSKLTHFLDLFQSNKVMFTSSSADVDALFGSTSATARCIRVGTGNQWQISSGSHNTSNFQAGMKLIITGVTYTVTRIIDASNFEASPAHGGGGSASSVTLPSSANGSIDSTELFIAITGFTHDTTQNRNYRVSSYTDTTLTLKDMAGNAAALGTASAVTIAIKGIDGSSLAVGYTGGTTYAAACVETVNGATEPINRFNIINTIIPHRAWYDTETKLDFGSMDTVVVKFNNIIELGSEFAPLSEEVRETVGAICDDEFAGTTLSEISFSQSGTQRWNRAQRINYTDTEGLLNTNYRNGATATKERIYGAEILFRPYIKYNSSTMHVTDTLEESGEETLFFEVYNDVDYEHASNQNTWLNYCNNLTGYYFYNENDSTLHKVISHEINRTRSAQFRHLLKLDNMSSVTDNDILRLMRINQVCMYDFTPKRIVLNDPKPEYTKIPGQDKTHNIIYDATRMSSENDGSNMFLDTTNNTKGVLSMYVLIDPDGTNTNTYLETRTSAKATSYSQISDTGKRVYVTDGVNNFATTLTKKDSSLEFEQIKKVLGTPSVGTIFTIKVNRSPNFKPETATIGASFKIVDEIETIINDAFQINDISYTQDTQDEKYYGAFNFTGQSLYSAANNLLSYKDKEILVDGEEIKIVDKEDEKKYRDIILSSKNSDFQITSISNDVSLLDNFDEVIVIGDGVRGIARNPISTTDANRTIKTKEIYDYSILDQRQADLKAIQYLDVFNTSNTSIEIEVADNVPFLKPGHIIELEFEEQNIPRGDYLVIETEKEFGRPTKFILSEYSKDLAGTFSLLMGEIRNLQGFTKQKVYTSTTIPRIKRDKVNIKFVKSTATLTSGITTTSTIGFGYTIGFNSEVGV